VKEKEKENNMAGKDFISELNSILSDEKFGYNEDQVMIKTGFPSIDYLNGNSIKLDKGTRYNVGVDAGKIVTIIGKTGTGKSTLAVQMAASIVRRYDQGSMFILDFEQSNSEDRVRSITGMGEKEFNQKVSIKKIGISTETVLEMASQIKKLKLEHKKDLLVDNKEGIVGEDGKPVKILPPTVVIVDSIAMMMPRDVLSTEEMTGQMSATQMAKANTQLFKRLVQVAMEGNIIFIFINHINQKISTGPTPTAASINYLKQDETLPGGNAPQYLTNTLIKVTASSKLDEEKTYKIKGFEAKVELVKSRTAPAGRSITMVFNQAEGFDSELSLLEFVKSNGLLKGAGVSYFLEGLESVKFKLSDFKQKLSESKELRKHFDDLTSTLLKDSLKQSSLLSPATKVEGGIEEEDVNGEE
jgi:RecA/RadA recombinase